MSRYRCLLVACCVLSFAAPASAQPKVGQVQPDSLLMGTLHTDAIAEASFLVYAPPDDPKPKVKVDAPKFVKVLGTSTEAREIPPGNSLTCVSVEIAIDTTKAGELKGEIAVTVGDLKVKQPVSATVKVRKPGTPRVLVVGTPFHRYSTSDGKHFNGWRAVVDSAGLDVSYLLIHEGKPVTRDLDLAKFDTVLMGLEALFWQGEEDVKRVRAFAENGGRVVIAAHAYLGGAVKKVNALLEGYGLEMKDVRVRVVAKEVVVQKDLLAEDVAKAGVEKLKFRLASPVSGDKGRVLVGMPNLTEEGYGYAATAKVGKGEVVGLCVSLWWAWVSEAQAKDSDNAKFLGWLLAARRKG